MTQKTHLWLVRTALIAALYVALTLSFSAISYGPVQFRVSEILILLPLYDRRWTVGLVLGTIIANFFSPLGVIDVVFGSGATLIALVAMTRVAKLTNEYLALACPVIANAYIIAIELAWVYGTPYWESVLWVGVGEAIIVAVGFFVWKIMSKNPHIYKLLKAV